MDTMINGFTAGKFRLQIEAFEQETDKMKNNLVQSREEMLEDKSPLSKLARPLTKVANKEKEDEIQARIQVAEKMKAKLVEIEEDMSRISAAAETSFDSFTTSITEFANMGGIDTSGLDGLQEKIENLNQSEEDLQASTDSSTDSFRELVKELPAVTDNFESVIDGIEVQTEVQQESTAVTEESTTATETDSKAKTKNAEATDANKITLEGFSNTLSDVADYFTIADQAARLFGDNTDNTLAAIGHNITGVTSGILGMTTAMKGMNADDASLTDFLSGGMAMISGAMQAYQALFARGGIFGGPTDQQLLADQGKKAGATFGTAFDAEAQAAMERIANQLPKAASGAIDIAAAMWHPETVDEILDNITDMGLTAQNEWAQNLEDHTRSVLQNNMGLGDEAAAAAMAPLLQEILDKIAPGGPMDNDLKRMVDWAESFGIELTDSFERAEQLAGEISNSLMSNFGNSISNELAMIDSEERMKKEYGDQQWQKMKQVAEKMMADGKMSGDERASLEKNYSLQERKDLLGLMNLMLQKTALAEQYNELLQKELELEEQIAAAKGHQSRVPEGGRPDRVREPEEGGGREMDGQFAGGGYVPRQGIYGMAEQGPEFVMSNDALNRYGLDFLSQLNNGTAKGGSGGQIIMPITVQQEKTAKRYSEEAVVRHLEKGREYQQKQDQTNQKMLVLLEKLSQRMSLVDNNVPANITINTDNPTGFRSYLASGGNKEIQQKLSDAKTYGY
jgi:hypothetical protein